MTGLIGVGLYSRSEAARLTREHPSNIKRWLRGYTTSEGVTHPPMWRPDIDDGSGDLLLSFRDMLDVGTIRALRQKRFSAQFLRKAIARAAELLGSGHPFTTASFKTDGVSILLQVDREQREPELLNIITDQREMHAIIEQSLQNIEYAGQTPALWRPLGKRGGVVLDPRRSFGAPIEEETSIPTATLAAAVKAEGDVRRVADLYEIPASAVNRAMQFEEWLAKAA